MSVILVTDPRWSFARIEEVTTAAASALGSRLVVQLRDKEATADALRSAAEALRAITSPAGARLVVNAPRPEVLEVARRAAADGVHVPCHAAAIERARAIFAWVSAPAHDDDDVLVADAAGAAAVLVSPIWATPGKGEARGEGALVRARQRTSRAVYALGGVDPSRAAACARAGATGVAVIRALLDAERPGEVARALDAPFLRP